MSGSSGLEELKIGIVSHLEELRRRLLSILVFFIVLAVLAFWQGELLMMVLKIPVEGIIDKFIFISPTEAFASYIKISALAGLVFSFPVIVYHCWKFVGPAFYRRSRKRVFLWFLLALVLFFSGIGFSFFVAMPPALNFLIGFPGEGITPAISLGEYVSFFSAIILSGGVIFQIPVVMALVSDLGLISPSRLKKKRKYAVILIMIFAAIITPTHDMVNMLIFALPMMLLYEVGILASLMVEKQKNEE